mgnify:FL=1
MDGIETYVQMVGRVAAAMYNAPDPNDPDAPSDPWPPSHLNDLAWWMTRAQAAVHTIREM